MSNAFAARMAMTLDNSLARLPHVTFSLDGAGRFTGDAAETSLDSKLRREGGGDVDMNDLWLMVSRTSMPSNPRIGAQLLVLDSDSPHMPAGMRLEISHMATDEISYKLFLVEPATE